MEYVTKTLCYPPPKKWPYKALEAPTSDLLRFFDFFLKNRLFGAFTALERNVCFPCRPKELWSIFPEEKDAL
jgi:hypothetical protein